MRKKCFTISTRLNVWQFDANYFNQDLIKQNKIFRIVWKLTQMDKRTQSQLNTYLQKTFQIDKRTANSLLKIAKGRRNALKELKTLERANLTTKIIAKTRQIEKLSLKIAVLKEKVVANQATEKELCHYRNDKQSLWHKKQKLNRMKQKLKQYEQTDPYYKICWGSKRLFKAQYHLEENGFSNHREWLDAFRAKRDSQINFVGSAEEPCGNQNCQLSYNEATDLFSLRVRKDLEYMADEKDKFMVIEHLNFKLHRDRLIEVLKERATPLTFRILKRGHKWYLQVIFTWRLPQQPCTTSKGQGTIGLDFNSGFIVGSETDYYGNMVNQYYYPLKYHGTGNKAKSEMQETIARIVAQAKQEGKALVIEDLRFDKTKAKANKSTGRRGKNYNKMIHAFDYSRYKQCIDNACHRHNVELVLVNPAYTSRIGSEKFSNRMKLSTHQAASYVIARKGQGFADKHTKEQKKRQATFNAA